MSTLIYLKTNWHIIVGILIVVGLAVWAYVDWQFVQMGLRGPKDTVGNGITVGLAKAFDNRSLSLRIEALSNSLAKLKVVDSKATENVGKIQGQTSNMSSRSVSIDVNSGKAPTKNTPEDSGKTPPSNGESKTSESKSEVTLAAGDVLNEQLNLASQIMNLQTLYERSLTDRLIGQEARLQTVLGFQVSITPPAGFENCVAIAEISVRMKPNPCAAVPAKPVSLVALIPQEKTYNSQSISSDSRSIGGSAVASVVSLGVNSKGESRQLFIHRDSDTVAFERNSNTNPQLFPNDDAIVFGWEFRPVLGRKTVSPGMRQMLAVIALPNPDTSEHQENLFLQIKTRSYWRRYNSETQTSAPKWHWFPQKIDGSRVFETKEQELAIPTTSMVQQGLAPNVAKISWVNSGDNLATVIVKGENFFPGTKILVGGKELREDDGLTLKSDQALEFETKLSAIASGDAVLSGRFGRSSQLEAAKIPGVQTLYITRAVIKQSRRGRDLRLSIEVKGIDDSGDDIDLNVADLGPLPEPVLFIGNEPIPMPYDYWPVDPHEPTAIDPTAQSTKGAEFSFAKPSTKKSIRVEAWIPPRMSVTRNSSVMFRVPFCGLDYQASWPLQFYDPSITRIGGNAADSYFRISHSLWHEKKMTVELDQVYASEPELVKVGDGDYRFKISNNLLAQYQNLILRIESGDGYLLQIPEDKPKPKPVLDLNVKPPEVAKGTIGPAEWSGTDLNLITAATLVITPVGSNSTAASVRKPAAFTFYDGGKKIAVYFDVSSTDVPGRAEVEFQAPTGVLNAPLSITT
ncbi:MAG TPA: hypothetical protein VGD61_16395 [Pyrinomonadaceae bacterium]